MWWKSQRVGANLVISQYWMSNSHGIQRKVTLDPLRRTAAQILPVEVRDKARAVPGVTDAKVEIVWEPPWDKSRMSEAAKLQLGIDDW